MKPGDTIWILNTHRSKVEVEKEEIKKVGSKWVYYGYWGNFRFDKVTMSDGSCRRVFLSEKALDEYQEKRKIHGDILKIVDNYSRMNNLSLDDLKSILNILKSGEQAK